MNQCSEELFCGEIVAHSIFGKQINQDGLTTSSGKHYDAAAAAAATRGCRPDRCGVGAAVAAVRAFAIQSHHNQHHQSVQRAAEGRVCESVRTPSRTGFAYFEIRAPLGRSGIRIFLTSQPRRYIMNGDAGGGGGNLPEIELIIKASAIDGKRKGADIFCQVRT